MVFTVNRYFMHCVILQSIKLYHGGEAAGTASEICIWIPPRLLRVPLILLELETILTWSPAAVPPCNQAGLHEASHHTTPHHLWSQLPLNSNRNNSISAFRLFSRKMCCPLDCNAHSGSGLFNRGPDTEGFFFFFHISEQLKWRDTLICICTKKKPR